MESCAVVPQWGNWVIGGAGVEGVASELSRNRGMGEKSSATGARYFWMIGAFLF